jgi:hypothetical protein
MTAMVGLNPLDLGNGSRRRVVEQSGSGDTVASLRLIRPLADAVWLGEVDGELVTARPAVAAVDRLAPDAWVPGAPAAWPDDDHPHLIAPRGTATVGGSTWTISPYRPGVRLDRLMARAILTPLQAAYVAIDVAAGLVELHRAGLAHGRLREEAVVVGEDGRSLLTDWMTAVPVAADAVQALRRDDLSALRAMIARLARGADRPVTRRRAADARLLTGLITLTADQRGADSEVYLSGLTTLVLDCVGAELPDVDLRAQVAAVARAAGGADTAARAGTPRRSSPPLLPTPLSKAAWGRPRRRRLWLLAGVVAVALAAGAVFARAPLTSLADRLLHRHPAVTTSTAQTHPRALKPVPKLAPTASGPIRAVTVRTLGSCRPGHSCRIRVTVRTTPRPHRSTVHWTVRTFNRCTGAQQGHAGGVVKMPAHARSASGTGTFAMPTGRALAAVVLTTSPARAAARPLLLPASVSAC